MPLLLRIIGECASWVSAMWLWVWFFSVCLRIEKLKDLAKELWFIQHHVTTPIMVVYMLLDAAYGASKWNIANALVWTLIRWMHRHDGDDDDRWKKRKKSLSKVKVLKGKLVVVPTTS